jgi:hypothetical protein
MRRFATFTHEISRRKPTAPSSQQCHANVRHDAIGELLCTGGDTGIALWMFALERRGDRLELAIGGVDRHALLQPADGVEAGVIAAIQKLRRSRHRPHRHEHVVRAYVLKRRRQHTDNGVDDVVEDQRAVDDAAIRAELRAPE